MIKFVNDDFLLDTQTARKLYHQIAEGLPILDFHTHLSAEEICRDIHYENITQAWLLPDKYKWQILRSNGVSERLITGEGSDREKWTVWCEVLPKLVGSSLVQWAQIEMKRFFRTNQMICSGNEESLWNMCNEALQTDAFSVRNILKRKNVKMICTTEPIMSDLHWHSLMKETDFRMIPTFNADPLFNINSPDYDELMQQMQEQTRQRWDNWENLKEAIRMRMDAFDAHDCCLSDHTLGWNFFEEGDDAQVQHILNLKKAGKKLGKQDLRIYRGAMLTFLAEEYKKRNWVMQIHFGDMPKGNDLVMEEEAESFYYEERDLMRQLDGLFITLLKRNGIPKTILYSMNLMDYQILAMTASRFQDPQQPGKIQLGSTLWLSAYRNSMAKLIDSLAEIGQLSRFVGVMSDSGSIFSLSRHEVFRRILCASLGEWVETGEIPYDEEQLKNLIEDLCYRNTSAYFNFPV